MMLGHAPLQFLYEAVGPPDEDPTVPEEFSGTQVLLRCLWVGLIGEPLYLEDLHGGIAHFPRRNKTTDVGRRLQT